MIPRITAEVIAPPAPCTNRAAISISWLCASPHSADATVNTASPIMKIALPAHEIAQTPRQEQQAAERDQVRVHDPGKARL